MKNKTPHCVPDLEREDRIGFAEVIYCQGKTDEQLRTIAVALFASHRNVLASRCNLAQYKVLRKLDERLQYHPEARIAFLHEDKTMYGRGTIAVVSAGTTDIPVAEEAAITAEVMGNRVERHYDIGVAGIHRLLERRDALAKAEVVIAVAGMEGALPSVLGGLLPCPVIAVPTSIGYGASLEGITALLGMLCSCAPGITVVNIDNGFGAGYAAARINRIRR
ncbi:MAG: nickel pincer cofactor biosynthesis protein LarB [Lentisphaerae bacterium]|jgi:NCAIR mutase (PurE)-related protein|nr:nickel pincer cofactor biosynthesis protein LarB [Lentisphaerota bacterium]